jgi:hypothetical protein
MIRSFQRVLIHLPPISAQGMALSLPHLFGTVGRHMPSILADLITLPSAYSPKTTCRLILAQMMALSLPRLFGTIGRHLLTILPDLIALLPAYPLKMTCRLILAQVMALSLPRLFGTMGRHLRTILPDLIALPPAYPLKTTRKPIPAQVIAQVMALPLPHLFRTLGRHLPSIPDLMTRPLLPPLHPLVQQAIILFCVEHQASYVAHHVTRLPRDLLISPLPLNRCMRLC